jgi:hypothetical protein
LGVEDLIVPGIVVDATIQLNFEHQSSLIQVRFEDCLVRSSAYQSVVVRTYDHTLSNSGSLSRDINGDDVTELDGDVRVDTGQGQGIRTPTSLSEVVYMEIDIFKVICEEVETMKSPRGSVSKLGLGEFRQEIATRL